MARIAREELERLKREVSIKALAEQKGIELRRQGKDWAGLCPFHEETSASLIISPAKNLFHCFGCGAAGSAVDWVMKSENVSFRHAVEILRELQGRGAAALPEDGRPLAQLAPALERSVSDEKLLLQVVDYYHQSLLDSPRALGYLQKRGLMNAEMVKRFQLGFSNRTLGYRLPGSTGSELRERLRELGILRPSGHERYNGSLVVPVFDEHGRLSELYGRKITSRLRKGTALHLYLPRPDGEGRRPRGVWNVESFAASSSVIVCEALLDALTLWSAGFRNVTSSYGTQGFTAGHLQALLTHQVREVLIAYDRDEAGDRAAEALGKKLSAAGIGAWRVELPREQDINAFALNESEPPEALGRLLRRARWMGEGEAPSHPIHSGAAVLRAIEPAPERSEREMEPAPLEAPAGSEPGKAEAEAPAETDTGPEPLTSAPEQPAEPAPVPSSLAASPAALPSVPSGPASSAPSSGAVLEQKAGQLECRFSKRYWRVRGLSKNTSPETLRINLFCSLGEDFHLDTLDLYSARQRSFFVKATANELGIGEAVIKRDIGRLLLALEELHEEKLRKTLQPGPSRPKLSEDRQEAALSLLRDPNLIGRIGRDFEKCGLVGEGTNKLIGYLAAVSRKLERPLGVLIQSSSAAGKSSLMEAVLSLMPAEETVKFSAMTGQALYYMGERGLRHKILAIAEEEGSQRASYALKLLLSEGELSIASTGKDPQTGKLLTHEYRIEGPVVLLCSTTAIEVDEELMNRCLVLSVDEGREQTRAIHRQQRRRRTLSGLFAAEQRAETQRLHQDAQRLLRPLSVLNPYAEELTFLDDRTRLRRDHEKYLTLIDSIALLRQYQRPLRTGSYRGKSKSYCVAQIEDIELANELSGTLFGRTLDELPPQTRRFLELLHQMVSEECQRQGLEQSDYRFWQKDVRARLGWSAYQVKTHLRKLVELEYVLAHRGRRGQSMVYELLYRGEGQSGRPFVMGLLDAKKLCEQSRGGGYDEKWEHSLGEWEDENGQREGPGSSEGAPREVGGSGRARAEGTGDESEYRAKPGKNAVLEREKERGEVLPLRRSEAPVRREAG